MKIQGTYTFQAPLELVWRALFDPIVLAKTLPGCEKLEREGNQFKGDINVKMGPVQGKFQGKVDITDVKELESYTMVVDGRGPAGFGKATAQLRLNAEGGATRLEYDSDVQVGGRIASVGQRLLEASSRAIVKQSLEGLHDQIKALAADVPPAALPVTSPAVASIDAAAAAPGAVSEVGAVAPKLGELSSPSPQQHVPATAAGAVSRAAVRNTSQAAFALGVAKEVTKELLPVKTVLVVLGVLVLAWVIYRAAAGG